MAAAPGLRFQGKGTRAAGLAVPAPEGGISGREAGGCNLRGDGYLERVGLTLEVLCSVESLRDEGRGLEEFYITRNEMFPWCL